MSRLFIASDGHELCLWEGEPDDPQPRCVERESDVDPVVWSLIVAGLREQNALTTAGLLGVSA